MSTAAVALADAWKRHVAAPAAPVRPVISTATAAPVFDYTLARAHDYDRQACVLKGDAAQPCNPEGGTYIASRSDHRQQRLCGNHAARLAHAKGLRFPLMSPS